MRTTLFVLAALVALASAEVVEFEEPAIPSLAWDWESTFDTMEGCCRERVSDHVAPDYTKSMSHNKEHLPESDIMPVKESGGGIWDEAYDWCAKLCEDTQKCISFQLIQPNMNKRHSKSKPFTKCELFSYVMNEGYLATKACRRSLCGVHQDRVAEVALFESVEAWRRQFTPAPTAAPTASPTAAPTASPTVAPTPAPTAAPTASPTAAPTASPTVAPTPGPTPTMACTYTDEKGCGEFENSADFDLYNVISDEIEACFYKEDKATCETAWIANDISKDCCKWGPFEGY